MAQFLPEIWSLPAQLAERWQKIAVSVVAIGGAADSLAKLGSAPVRWVASKLPRPPRESHLRFVPDDYRSRWIIVGDSQATHVHGRWDVTNVSDGNVIILKARLRGRETAFSHVSTRQPEGNVFGPKHPIPAHRTSEVSADFSYFPAICSGHEPLVADVIFTDNYGEEHVAQSVRFRHMARLLPMGFFPIAFLGKTGRPKYHLIY